MAPLLASRGVGRFAAVAGAYFLVSLVGVAFVVQPEQLSVFWPGGGLAVGCLLTCDRRRWPTVLAAVFIGNVAGNLAHGHTLAVSSGFAVANCIEPCACAWLLGLRGRFRLARASAVGWLFVVPGGVCAGTALFGAGIVTAGLGAPSYWGVWKVWWLADALGVVLFAPLLLVWSGAVRFDRVPGWRGIESILLILVLAAVSWAIFVADLGRAYPFLSFTFPILPLLLGIAIRSAAWWTAVAVAVSGLIAVWGTICGSGPVGGLALPAAEEVLLTQGFVAVVCLSSLVLATTIRERREREAEVGELNRVLADRVREAERVAAALRESEDRFQAIFHSQFQFIGLMTPDGTLVEANRTALAAAGMAEADVIGRPFWETGWWTHDPAQQDRLRAATAAAAHGARARFEASHPTAEGGLMWVDFSLTPFRDDTGRVVLLIPEGRDITDRKRVEARLRESEERLRQAAAAAAVGVWEWNLVTNKIYWNDQMFHIYQVAPTPDGLVSYDTWTERVLPEDLSRQENLLRETVEQAGGGNRTFRIRHPNGGCRHIEAAEGIRTNAHGRVEWVVGTNLDVTDRKAMEERLRESEERFELAVRGSQDGIWDWHVDTGVVYFSPRWKGMLGYAEDEVPNRFVGWEQLVHPDDLPQATAALTGYLSGQTETYSVEFRMREKGGGYRWILARGVALRDAVGRPYRVAGSHTDVTDRRRAEEALRLSEARFKGLAENAPVGIYETDAAGNCLYVNARWCAKAGLSSDQAAGRRWESAIHPDDRDRVAAEWCAAAEAGQEFVSEYRFRAPDGRVTWLSGRAVGIRHADGQVHGYLGTVMNVTARKEAEDALRQSEERYRSVVDALAEGIVVQNATGEIVTFNDRAGQILGLSRDQLTGRTSFDAEWRAIREDGSPFRGEDHPAIVALRTGQPVFDELMGVERPNRERVWLSINAVPFGAPARQVVASFHDVTEARRLNARILASLGEKEVMLREIHHRVKNNLAVIASLFHLQSGYTTDEPILRLLKEAQDRVRSMALVHEHLYNSADLGAVNFGEYVRSLVEQLFRSYRLPGPAVALAFDIGPVTLGIDQAVPCGLVLNELISNALKHAFPDRGGTLTVALAVAGGECVLRVTDDGVGVPADHLEGKPRSLGLRLIRTLARQLGGPVEFRPAAPGTDVRLRFPIHSPAPRS